MTHLQGRRLGQEVAVSEYSTCSSLYLVPGDINSAAGPEFWVQRRGGRPDTALRPRQGQGPNPNGWGGWLGTPSCWEGTQGVFWGGRRGRKLLGLEPRAGEKRSHRGRCPEMWEAGASSPGAPVNPQDTGHGKEGEASGPSAGPVGSGGP